MMRVQSSYRLLMLMFKLFKNKMVHITYSLMFSGLLACFSASAKWIIFYTIGEISFGLEYTNEDDKGEIQALIREFKSYKPCLVCLKYNFSRYMDWPGNRVCKNCIESFKLQIDSVIKYESEEATQSQLAESITKHLDKHHAIRTRLKCSEKLRKHLQFICDDPNESESEFEPNSESNIRTLFWRFDKGFEKGMNAFNQRLNKYNQDSSADILQFQCNKCYQNTPWIDIFLHADAHSVTPDAKPAPSAPSLRHDASDRPSDQEAPIQSAQIKDMHPWDFHVKEKLALSVQQAKFNEGLSQEISQRIQHLASVAETSTQDDFICWRLERQTPVTYSEQQLENSLKRMQDLTLSMNQCFVDMQMQKPITTYIWQIKSDALEKLREKKRVDISALIYDNHKGYRLKIHLIQDNSTKGSGKLKIKFSIDASDEAKDSVFWPGGLTIKLQVLSPPDQSNSEVSCIEIPHQDNNFKLDKLIDFPGKTIEEIEKSDQILSTGQLKIFCKISERNK